MDGERVYDCIRMRAITGKEIVMAEFLLGLIIGVILTIAGLYWYTEWR